MSAPVAHQQILISGDSHMSEPPELWTDGVPARFKEQAPTFPNVKLEESQLHLRAGGWNAKVRLQDMDVDHLAAEILYPTSGPAVWRVEDIEAQEACVKVYNDWLIDFCSADFARLWGLGMVSLLNIDHAIAEMKRCKEAGLRGMNIYIATPQNLPYSSAHYEPFWTAAEDMGVPLGMHINGRAKGAVHQDEDRVLHSVNGHKFDVLTSVGHLIQSGVMERHPTLQFSIAEVGLGWIPFWLQEFDYYSTARAKLPLKPSEYFARQVTSTFISDAVGGILVADYAWLRNVGLWSTDYPHIASMWPDSQPIMTMDLGHLAADIQDDVICNNAARVFNHGKLPPAPPAASEDYVADIQVWLKSNPNFGWMARGLNAPEAGRTSD